MSATQSTDQAAVWAKALPVMLAVVGIRLVGATLLKILAVQASDRITLLLLLGVGGVMLLNVLRFVAWGYAHRRFPLSTTFPLASAFFPLMLLIAWSFGDPIGLRQVAGASLITGGVIWLSYKARA